MAQQDRIDTENSILAQVLTGTAVEITVGAASATHGAALAVGRHTISANTDCRILQGVFGSTTALATSTFLASGTIRDITVTLTGTDDGLAAIQDSAAGALTITPLVSGI